MLDAIAHLSRRLLSAEAASSSESESDELGSHRCGAAAVLKSCSVVDNGVLR